MKWLLWWCLSLILWDKCRANRAVGDNRTAVCTRFFSHPGKHRDGEWQW